MELTLNPHPQESRTVRPTSFALELLASKADFLAVDGTDRWVGAYDFRDIRLAGALIRLSDA